MKTHSFSPSGEQGAVLVVSLIFLVILALLGTSGAINNTMQERMASNTRNRNLAFQAAEHALKAADDWITTQTITTLDAVLDPNGDDDYADEIAGDGIRPNGELHANDSAYWLKTFNWGSTDLRSATTNLGDITSQPRYVVEKMPSASCPSGGTCDFYRVTARCLGGTGAAVAILQSMYRFK